MTQTFRAPVGQVAGRDIVNLGPPTEVPLTERSTEWLLARRAHCRRKQRSARQIILKDMAVPLALAGLVGNLVFIYLVVERTIPAGYTWWLPVWLVLTVVVPLYRLDVRRRREAALIRHYGRELDAIEIVLYDRS